MPTSSGSADVPDPVPVGAAVAHGAARLLPDVDRPRAWLLTVDGAPQSYVDLDDPTHLEFEYVRRLGHVLDTAAPEGAPLRLLHLGGGALTLPRYAAHTRPGSPQTVAENDGPLAAFVSGHLPLPPGCGIELLTCDAAEALGGRARERPASDLVVADVFAGSRTPSHLTTRAFLRSVAATLRPGGGYAANVADSAPFGFLRSQLANAVDVFAEVCLIAEPSVLRGRRFGNVVVVASDGPLPLAELARRCAADPFPARVVHGAGLDRLIGDARPVDGAGGPSPVPPSGSFGVG
ncbi:spermidine synthase [Streptomyces sp. SM14]|uniref:spermidine synthase n=2 Tax=unclassified Streptomyces TaxID=2593676 RepID=UPI000CD4ECB7|nr:fused MFS/spermidine synthase [Streptomyces sp. SM14]